jgi:hypothetical protein
LELRSCRFPRYRLTTRWNLCTILSSTQLVARTFVAARTLCCPFQRRPTRLSNVQVAIASTTVNCSDAPPATQLAAFSVPSVAKRMHQPLQPVRSAVPTTKISSPGSKRTISRHMTAHTATRTGGRPSHWHSGSDGWESISSTLGTNALRFSCLPSRGPAFLQSLLSGTG